MENRYSLKIKLIISFWIALVAALAIPSYYFMKTVGDEIERETVQSVGERMSILEWSLSRQPFEDLSLLDMAVREIGDASQDRITVISTDGTVLVDSMVAFQDITRVENHGARQEFVDALNKGEGYSIRHSSTIDRHLIYYSRKTNIEPAGSVVLRLATPYATMDTFFDRVSTGLWQMMVLSLLFTGGLVFFVVRRLTIRLEPMISMAQAIGRGDYQKRINVSPGKEFDPLVAAINEMAGSIENNIEIVSSQKKELQTILDSIRDSLAALDNTGRIMSFNRSFQKTFTHQNNLIGKRPLEVFLSSELQEFCDETVRSGHAHNKSLEMNFRDRHYSVNIVAPDDHKKISAILVFHDITNIRRLENIRKDFVANASHELRTPLTSIKGYTETLLDNQGLFAAKGREILEIIIRNANKMIRLLDDILQLSKIESEPDTIVVESISLEPVVEKAWRNCKHLTRDKHVDFSLDLSRECSRVLGETEYLGHVFQNLFENSLKYGPDQVDIQVICQRRGSMVSVGVRDNGPGIPAEEQKRIFERFYRVKKYKQKIRGTGLGLAICRNIILNMGGEIWVESPVEGVSEGCIVWFSLKTALDSSSATVE